MQTNIQEVVEHGQTSAEYLFTKYKPDVDSHGTHINKLTTLSITYDTKEQLPGCFLF